MLLYITQTNFNKLQDIISATNVLFETTLTVTLFHYQQW